MSKIGLGTRRFLDEGFVFVSEEKAASMVQNTAYPNDLVFTQRGTIGQVAWIPKDAKYPKYILSQNQMKLTPDVKKADVGYLCYYFLSPLAQEIIAQNSIGSTIPGFNLTQLRNFSVPLPPLPTQQRIAQVLGRLDDKIEVNRRINRTLEAMAQALYKHWFVDFGPFQDGPFVESELGSIPRGWEVVPLKFFVEIDVTSTKPQENPNEMFNHYSIPALDEQSYPVQDRGAEVKSNKYAIMSDRILVSKLNPRIYRIWTVYHQNNFRSFSSTEFINYVCQYPLTWSFMNCYFRSDEFISKFRSRVTGTTGSRQRVKPTDTLSFLCIKPSDDVLQKFEKIVSPYFERMHHNVEENRKLAEIRDYLLPKLLSGEIEVSDSA